MSIFLSADFYRNENAYMILNEHSNTMDSEIFLIFAQNMQLFKIFWYHTISLEEDLFEWHPANYLDTMMKH